MKSLSDIFVADDQYGTVIIRDPISGQPREMTIADHHAAVASVSLANSVPEPVRAVFDRARNAFLYAWFVHDLLPVAEHQSFAALELSLRHSAPKTRDRSGGIAELLQMAYEAGIFNDLAVPRGNEDVNRTEYFTQLFAWIRRSRNLLAHGQEQKSLPGSALETLRNCAMLINHIFQSDRIGGSVKWRL